MYNNLIDYYPHVLEFVPEFFLTQKMCDKVVDAYPSTIKFVPECFMTQDLCNKAVNRRYFVFHSIPY